MKSHFIIYCLTLLTLSYFQLTAQIYPLVVIPQGSKKCGYIDSTGQFIVQPKYKFCHGFTEEGTGLVAKNNKQSKCYLFDTKGNEITPEKEIKLKRDPWTGIATIYSDSKLCFVYNGKFGAINSQGKVCAPFIYNRLTDFYDGYALGEAKRSFYIVKDDGTAKKFDTLELTYVKHFTEGLAPVEIKDRYWGFIDTSGNVVAEPQFLHVGYFKNGYAWVETKDKLVGCINKKGEWIVQPEYKKIGNFSAGLAWVRTSNYLIGFVDEKGEMVIEPQFSNAYNFDKESGLAMVKKDDQWCYVDTLGTIHYFTETDKTYSFSEGLAIGRKGSRVGFLNNNGEWAIKPEYEVVRGFQSGVAKARYKGKWGLLDKEGNWVLKPNYKKIGEISAIYHKYD